MAALFSILLVRRRHSPISEILGDVRNFNRHLVANLGFRDDDDVAAFDLGDSISLWPIASISTTRMSPSCTGGCSDSCGWSGSGSVSDGNVGSRVTVYISPRCKSPRWSSRLGISIVYVSSRSASSTVCKERSLSGRSIAGIALLKTLEATLLIPSPVRTQCQVIVGITRVPIYSSHRATPQPSLTE